MTIPPSATRRSPDLLLAGAALLAFQLATLGIADGWSLFVTPAWLDEFHSLFVAGHGTLVDSLRALGQGADFNPPLLPLAQRLVGSLSGGLDLGGTQMLPLRILSFACVWGALTGTYALLRPNYPSLVAFIAAASVWIHPLLLQHAFEARFYGPWALCTVLFALAASGARERQTWSADLAVALSAAALCLVHYFGIIAMGIVLLAQVAHDARTRAFDWRSTMRRLAPAVAGPLALAACVPLYMGQRNALTVATWITPTTPTTSAFYLLLVVWPLGFLGGMVRLAALAGRPPRQVAASITEGSARSRGTWTLLALAAMPLLLVLFSVVVQPTLIDRYAIVGVLSGAPIVAWSLTRVPGIGRVLVLLLMAFYAVTGIRHRVDLNRREPLANARLASDIAAHVEHDEQIVVEARHALYPLASLLPAAVAARMVLPELADSMRQRARPFDVVERDAARVHARLYRFPRLQRVEDLRHLDGFLLVTREDTSGFGTRWFPHHSRERVAPHILRLRLSPSIAAATRGVVQP